MFLCLKEQCPSLHVQGIIVNDDTEGCCHSSVESPAPTILPPRVWVPSTPSMLLSFIVKFVRYLSCEKNEINKNRPGLADFFLKKRLIKISQLILRKVEYWKDDFGCGVVVQKLGRSCLNTLPSRQTAAWCRWCRTSLTFPIKFKLGTDKFKSIQQVQRKSFSLELNYGQWPILHSTFNR